MDGIMNTGERDEFGQEEEHFIKLPGRERRKNGFRKEPGGVWQAEGDLASQLCFLLNAVWAGS